jgi:predicted permease
MDTKPMKQWVVEFAIATAAGALAAFLLAKTFHRPHPWAAAVGFAVAACIFELGRQLWRRRRR